MSDEVLCQLKQVIKKLDRECCPAPCCPPPPCGTCPCPANGFTSCYVDKPFVECCMPIGPPGPLPLYPTPVKPLQLPNCDGGSNKKRCPEEDFRSRYSNFYNNYNMDYHVGNPPKGSGPRPACTTEKMRGATVDGKSPCCEDYTAKSGYDDCDFLGCPTGFKPCTMKMHPPFIPSDPCGIWCAEVQPCPPKKKKNVSIKYVPGPCTRPCCKHWKPKGGPCLYDKPCKAACFNHPPGMKPSSEVEC